MEKADSSLKADHTSARIHDPMKVRKTLTRCCSLPRQLNSLTDALGSCIGDQSNKSAGVLDEPAVFALGTGVYFHNSPSNSDCDVTKFQDLFNLATVACEVEASIRHFQLVKKRRTPRNVQCTNGSRCFPHRNFRRRFSAAGAADGSKGQRIGHLCAGPLFTPSPWLAERSITQDHSSVFASKPAGSSIRKRCFPNPAVILRFGSHHNNSGRAVRGKMTASSQPPTKSSRIKFNKVSKGNCRLPSVLQPRALRLPGKDTRVQRVAKRILKFVGGGSTAEKFIRGALGNNPDTSKALRLLLTQRKVYRFGDGGRGKAFLYVATPAGLRELEQLQVHLITDEKGDDSEICHCPNHRQACQLSSTSNARVPPTSKAHDGILLEAPLCTPDNVNIRLPKASVMSKNVLQAVLGKH